MRLVIIVLLLLSPLIARSSDTAELNQFVEAYWSAIRSRDPEEIFAFYDPRVFSQLSPAEAAFVKEYWTKVYLRSADQQGDSHEIRVKPLEAGGNLLPDWRWTTKPEYQVEIHTFRAVENGKEGVTMIADTAAKIDGKYHIVRPVPPPDVLKKQMEKAKPDAAK